MAEHDPALVEKAAEAVRELLKAFPSSPTTLVPPVRFGATEYDVARVVLDKVTPAIREAALLEAADELRAMLDGFPRHGSHTRAGWAVEMLRLMARRQREEATDGR